MSDEQQNVVDLDRGQRKLGYIDRGYSMETYFDDRSLSIDSKRGARSEPNKLDLWRLHPDFTVGKASNKYSFANLRSGLTFFCSSIIVFYSEFHSMIPLLAPFFFLGLVRLVAAYTQSARGLYTRIYHSSGTHVLSIPHHGMSQRIRESFEKTLTEAIREARANAYGVVGHAAS